MAQADDPGPPVGPDDHAPSADPGSAEAPLAPEARRRVSRRGRNLTLAVGSAVLFAALFLTSAFVNPWAMLAFVAVVEVIAILEVDAALRSAHGRPPTVAVLLTGVPMLAAAYVYGPPGQLAALVVMILGVVVWALADRRDPAPLRSAGGALLIGLWVAFLASFLGLLLRRPDGAWLVIITVALTAASDIAAYAVGSRFGRRKMAPAVSPGKTWEGAAGAIVTTTVVAGGVVPLLVDQVTLGLAVVFGAVVAVVAVAGDLAESAVKRSLGIKDLGRLLPGHGGMMDRVDAMLFTLPVAHLVLLAGRL